MCKRAHALFLFFLLISVRSAPSKPPATLPEEIIHCQYLLTSECVHKTHTYTDSHTVIMPSWRALSHSNAHILVPISTLCHTAQHLLPPHTAGCTCIQMYKATHAYPKRMLTPSVLVFKVCTIASVYDKHLVAYGSRKACTIIGIQKSTPTHTHINTHKHTVTFMF